MSKLYRSLVWAGLVTLGVAACGDDVTITPPPPPPVPPVPGIRSVTVAPDGATLQVGATLQMTAAVTTDPGAPTPTISWFTSDATKATVNATGLVTGVAPGSVGIRARATAGTSTGEGTATVNVVAAPTCSISGVSVSPTSAGIVVGESFTAAATVSGTNCSAAQLAANWSLASPAGVVTVSATTGLITGVAPGTAVVRATSTQDPTKSATLSVTVRAPSVATVSIADVQYVPPPCPAPPPGGPCGTGSIPVNLSNVFGQIEITANVNAGEQVLVRLDAKIGGRVVASQTFPGTSAPSDPAAGPQAAPVTITLSTNTRQLRDGTTGRVPVIFNGNQFIALDLYVQGQAAPLASNAVPIVMNNLDAFYVQPGVDGPSLRRTAVVAPAPVVVGANTWFKGSQTATGTFIAYSNTLPTAFNYSASTVCGPTTPAGATLTGTPTSGITVSGVFPCAAVEGQNFLGAAPAAVLSYAPATTGPDGTGLATVGTLAYTNVGTGFNVPTGPPAAPALELRYNPIALAVIPSGFIDNEGPSVDIASSTTLLFASMGPPTGRAVAANISFDQWWISGGTTAPDPITAAFAFTNCVPASSKTADPGGVFTPGCGTSGYRAAADGGVGLAPGFPTSRVTVVSGATESCTGATVSSGADLAVTTTSSSDAYRICTYAEDLLANTSATALAAPTASLVSDGPNKSNRFGVDKVAPQSRFAGSATPAPTPAFAPGTPVVVPGVVSGVTVFNVSGEGNTAAPSDVFGLPLPTTAWSIEGQDDRSGFDQNLLVSLRPAANIVTRSNAGPPNPSTLTVACGAPTLWSLATGGNLSVLLSDGWVRNSNSATVDCGTGTNGIFTYSGSVYDRALNVSVARTSTYLIDTSRPTITGLGFPTGVLGSGAGGTVTSGTFTISAADNLDLNDAILGFNYPAANFPTSGQTGVRYTFFGAFGTNFDLVFTPVLNGQGFTHGPYIGRFDETCVTPGTPAAYPSCAIPAATAAELPTGRGAIAPADYLAGTAWQPGSAFASVRDGGHNYPASPFGITVPMLTTQTSPIAAPWSAANTFNFDATLSGTTVTVNHYTPTSLTLPFFDQVQLWRLSVAAGPLGTPGAPATANWVYCGVSSAVGVLVNDNGARRVWRWTMTVPTTGPCAESEVAAAPSWRVLGVLGAAGLFTNTF